MGKISTNELAAVLIERKNLKRKSASAFVNELFYVIQKGLGQDKMVKVKGLGTFKIIDVDDRESVNVNNGERVLIEGHSKITFTPDTLMKELVNKPFSQFETVVLNEGVDFAPEPEQEPEPEPEPDPEPVLERVSVPESEDVLEPEVVSESDVVDDVDASMAPLVDFVTDNEPQIISEPAPEPEPLVNLEPSEEPKSLETPEDPEPPIEQTPTPEPLAEPELQSEPELEPEPDPEPVEDELPKEEEPVETPSEETEYVYEEENSGAWKKWLLGILACCICFAGGYYFGMTYGSPSSSSEPQVEPAKPKVETVKPKVEVSKSEQATPEQAKPEATKPESQELKATEPEPKPEVKPETKPESKPEVKPDTKPESKPELKAEPKPESATALDKYEQMDSRVRTGAYRIVGTDHVEKVKATDNLARICKRTIGPGMECYLEVYNGIKGDADLKVGQEIKIPKLVHKKKKVQK
ncbi:MAG: HU family DNA-binding protein [Prevotella sp.]|jgi:nucleoid DNA-binding protein|nr:HU family DNA-binding protein [Prevotella sp.]